MLLLLACAHPVAPEKPVNADAVVGVADPELRQLLSDHWEAMLRRAPEFATRMGDHRHDDRLSDLSPASIDAGWADAEGFLARARGITPEGEADRLTLELFVEDLDTALATRRCHTEQWQLSARMNPVVDLNGLAEIQPLTTPEAKASLATRVAKAPAYVDGWIATLRRGIAEGRTPSIESARIVREQVRAELAKPDAEWALAPAGGSLAAAREAYTTFGRFLDEELLPAARPEERAGTLHLPDGLACYAALVRRETSLALDPAEVHRIGLAELESIHAEMRVLGSSLFQTSDLAAIVGRLRTDPALYFSTEAEVEGKASEALERAQAAAPRFFGLLPKAACVVKRVPDYEAPYTTIAYYRQPIPGEEPGEYRINTYAPTTRPRYEAEVLAWHEAVPGHHTQIAIAQELPALPAFRRHLGTTAYVEGWALYTERLADEMGLYSGDLDRMGMLSFDTWRASRLVVDTGLHAMGWDREKAVQFMLANTALAENNIRNEVDRYISWPGQATAYKIGQIEMWKLRRESEARMGTRFSLPGFHDVVLDGGAVTLPVLRRRVEAWAR